MPLEKVHLIEKLIPQRNIFLSVIFLRMAIPVDVLSYALGLFSSISFKLYFVATLVGVSPFAFIFSYSVLLPPWLQILFFSSGIIVLVVGYKKWYLVD